MKQKHETLKWHLMDHTNLTGTASEPDANLLYTIIFKAMEDNDEKFFSGDVYKSYCFLLRINPTVMDYIRHNVDHVLNSFALLRDYEEI